MNRLAFLRRMALAAAACAFIDVPWPKREERSIDPIPGLEMTDLTRLVHEIFTEQVIPAVRRENLRMIAAIERMGT